MKVRSLERKIFSVLLITALILSVLAVSLPQIKIVYATEIFSDGFESGDCSAWTGNTTNGGSILSVQSSVKHGGTYAANATDEEWLGNAYCYYTHSSNLASANATFYVYFEDFLPADGAATVTLIAFYDVEDSTERAVVKVVYSGGNPVLKVGDGTNTATGTTALSLDTWYGVKLFADYTNGDFKVYLGASEEASISGGVTGETVGSFRLGMVYRGNSASVMTMYFDDAVIEENEGDGETTITGSITDLTFPYNTTTKNMLASLKAKWTTNGVLHYWWLSTDYADGENYVNEPAQAFSGDWSNATKQLPNSIGTYHAYLYANTTTGEEGVTDIITFTTTDDPTIYLESADRTPFQEGVDYIEAEGSGYVYLPSGNFSLNADASSIQIDVDIPSDGINIVGQGINTTWLELPENDSAPNTKMIRCKGNSGGVVNITGISFMGRPDLATSPTGDSGITLQNCTDFRVWNCSFWRTGAHGVCVDDGSNMYGESGGNINWVSQGVVDHCYFYEIYKPVAKSEGRGYGYGVSVNRAYNYQWTIPNLYPDTPWNSTDGYGKYYKNTFIEDCYFTGCRHATQATGAGAYVLRYSTIEDMPLVESATTGHPVRLDSLGMYYQEIYNVTLEDTGLYGYAELGFHVEGGSALIYNNTIIDFYRCYSLGACEYVNAFHPLGHPNEIYIWDNEESGYYTKFWILGGACGDITEGVEYFLEAPNETMNYVAYTYPHPLVSGESPTYYYLNVTSETGGTTYPSAGVNEYLDGTNVTVTAYPSPGNSFANWTLDAGDGGTDNPTYIMMTANHTVTPNFDQMDYVVTLTPTTTGLTQGETVSITASVTKDGGAFTNYILNVTKDGSPFKQNIVASNSTFTDQENTATSHTYSISALIDSDEGGEVSYSITPVTVYWNIPSASPPPPAPSAPQPPAETEPEEPTTIPEEIVEEDVTLLVVGVAVITLIAITLVFASSREEKQPRGWRT